MARCATHLHQTIDNLLRDPLHYLPLLYPWKGFPKIVEAVQRCTALYNGSTRIPFLLNQNCSGTLTSRSYSCNDARGSRSRYHNVQLSHD